MFAKKVVKSKSLKLIRTFALVQAFAGLVMAGEARAQEMSLMECQDRRQELIRQVTQSLVSRPEVQRVIRATQQADEALLNAVYSGAMQNPTVRAMAQRLRGLRAPEVGYCWSILQQNPGHEFCSTQRDLNIAVDLWLRRSEAGRRLRIPAHRASCPATHPQHSVQIHPVWETSNHDAFLFGCINPNNPTDRVSAIRETYVYPSLDMMDAERTYLQQVRVGSNFTIQVEFRGRQVPVVFGAHAGVAFLDGSIETWDTYVQEIDGVNLWDVVGSDLPSSCHPRTRRDDGNGGGGSGGIIEDGNGGGGSGGIIEATFIGGSEAAK